MYAARLKFCLRDCLFQTASFLDKSSYVNLGGSREHLLDQFNIPRLLSHQFCTELNGYFGARTANSLNGELESCSAC